MKLYKENNHYSYIGLVLGILSMLLWLIPVAGLIASIGCLIVAYLGLDTSSRTVSIFALVLGSFGLILTFIRSGLVLLLT